MCNGEEGEIAFIKEPEIQYDVSNLVGWEGFNIEPPKGYKEENRYYRAPPIQLGGHHDDQSLAKMKKRLASQQQQGYVRGRMQSTNVESNNSSQPKNTKEESEPEPPGMGSAVLTEEKMQSPVQQPPAAVKCTDSGTPIVDTYSPYGTLPASDKWTCFTTDHIFFENLPESTGKYDKMVGILKKCREAKKDIDKLAVNGQQDVDKDGSNITPSSS